MRNLCWRPGNWLFAIHPFFALKPKVEDYDECGWSVWWLWFEIAHVSPPPSEPNRPTACDLEGGG